MTLGEAQGLNFEDFSLEWLVFYSLFNSLLKALTVDFLSAKLCNCETEAFSVLVFFFFPSALVLYAWVSFPWHIFNWSRLLKHFITDLIFHNCTINVFFSVYWPSYFSKFLSLLCWKLSGFPNDNKWQKRAKWIIMNKICLQLKQKQKKPFFLKSWLKLRKLILKIKINFKLIFFSQ